MCVCVCVCVCVHNCMCVCVHLMQMYVLILHEPSVDFSEDSKCLNGGIHWLCTIQVSGWTRLCEVELPNSIAVLVHHITEV